MKYTESSIVTIFHAANVNRFFSYIYVSFLVLCLPFFSSKIFPSFSDFPLRVNQVVSAVISNITQTFANFHILLSLGPSTNLNCA